MCVFSLSIIGGLQTSQQTKRSNHAPVIGPRLFAIDIGMFSLGKCAKFFDWGDFRLVTDKLSALPPPSPSICIIDNPLDAA